LRARGSKIAAAYRGCVPVNVGICAMGGATSGGPGVSPCGVPAAATNTNNVNVHLTGGTINFANTETPGVTGLPGTGIFASTGTGSINVTMDAGSAITLDQRNGVAGTTGITAIATGATPSAITVSIDGKIDPPDVGATITGNGGGILVPVGPNANVIANDIGIHVTNTGAGSINITTLAGSVINQGVNGGVQNGNVAPPLGGIITAAADGITSINVGGTITAQSNAIVATSTTGAISITTGAAPITGNVGGNLGFPNGTAIAAHSTAGGNITIMTGSGLVTGSAPVGVAGGGNGVIDAATTGAGTISVTVGSGGVVTNSPLSLPDAINTRAVDGQTIIVTNGTVDSRPFADGNAISAIATGTGGISITTNALVAGSLNGILTSATTGPTVITVNANLIGGNNSVSDGIHATSTTGDIGITSAAGTTITGSNNGIFARATGAGNLTANIAGNVVGGPGMTMTSGGGNVIIAVLGSVTDPAGTAITATTNGATAGSVLVQSGLLVQGTTGIDAEVQNAGSTGNVTVNTTRGPVTGTAGVGINATNAGAGFVSVTTRAVTGTGAGNNAINAQSTGATAAGSTAVTVTTFGPIVAGTTGSSVGINATATGGNGNVVVDARGTVTANGTGINATTAGAGNVTVSAGGAVTGTTGNGIRGQANGSGNVSITTTNATVTGALGISAFALGAGNVNVNSLGGLVTGTVTDGINAITAGGGSVSVFSGAVQGVSSGITAVAASTPGTVSVITNGNVTATGAVGNGINAATGTGNALVLTGGNVAGGLNGINVVVGGVGAITIDSNAGTVTGTNANGIIASSAAGAVSVTTGAVTGGTNGINATSNVGGAVSVFTNGPVTGAATGTNTGIIAQQAGGNGAVVVSTGAGSNVSAGVGIDARAAGTGAITIETHGTVTGTGAAAGGVSGDAIHVVQTGSGAVTVQTFGAVTGNTANAGSDGIDISGGGTGPVLVHTYAPVTGDPAIIINMASSVQIVTDASSPTTANGPVVISGTSTASTVLVDVSANVTNLSAAGDGIFTNTSGAGGLAATANTINVRDGVAVTGIGAGFAAINANTSTGLITVNIGQSAFVTNFSGIGVRLNTNNGAASGAATLNNQGIILGLGTTAANPAILFANNSFNGLGFDAIRINNGPTGSIQASGILGPAGWAITPGTAIASANTQSIFISNKGGIIGRIALGAGANLFSNLSGGIWNTSLTSDFGTNAGNNLFNALGATINTVGVTTINGIGNISNGGVVNAGLALADSTSFNANAGQVQIVVNSNLVGLSNNTAIFNVAGCGSAACPGNTAGLIFTGAAGSSFSNSVGGNGGIINLQADHTPGGSPTTNAVTMNTTIFGTSDANYTYHWGPTYNFNGDVNGGPQSPNSRLWVDTFLGAPGSTSDRLIFSGNATGSTRILVNDPNAGPGAFNPLGITVVALGGTSNGSNFVVDPLSKNWVNFGPLGAISKGFFLYPLVYVPGGAIGASPNGNAYKFLGVPGPFAFNLPVATTGAQSIFAETADMWEDRQIETRGCMQRGLIAAGQAWGSGADMNPVYKARMLLPDCAPGVWTKVMGSWSRRQANASLGTIAPALNGLTFDNSYRQTTEAVLAGIDFGRPELFSPYDAVVFSVMGGYISSFLDFNQPNALLAPVTTTSFKYTGGTVGVSATYMSAGFFVDALLKADFLNLNVGGIPSAYCTANAISCNQDINARTYGIVSTIGKRFELGRYFVEPAAALMWTNTHIDDLSLPAAAVVAQFNRANRTDIGGGARVGGTVMDDRVHYLEASVLGRIWDRVSSDNNTVSFLNLGPTFQITDNFKRSYGEVAVQLDWINRTGSGWSAFSKADLKFNSELQTYTAKAGVRYQFGWTPATVVTR
jgi:hypothetical protein